MSALFNDGKDRLRKLKYEKQHFKANHGVVMLSLKSCPTTPLVE
jgi:hypothetical protein